jgi:hypothetical protein
MKPTILAITSVVLLGSFAIAQNQTPEVPPLRHGFSTFGSRISSNSLFQRPTPCRRRSIPLRRARVSSRG